MFNQDQIKSIVRTVTPSILTFLVGRYPEYAGLIGEIVAVLGTVGTAGWGVSAHTTDAKLAAAEALDTVKKIEVKQTADMRPIINDPDRPKVVAAQ
jgi:hypothetical protein